jgi:hypothetical protein
MVIRWVVGCLIAPTCAFWSVAIVASPASAQVSLSIYRSAVKEGISESNKTYVTGLGRGVLWANVAAEDNGIKLFCPPAQTNFDPAFLASLLDQEIREPLSGIPWKDDTPIELIMVYAFVDKFPCKK